MTRATTLTTRIFPMAMRCGVTSCIDSAPLSEVVHHALRACTSLADLHPLEDIARCVAALRRLTVSIDLVDLAASPLLVRQEHEGAPVQDCKLRPGGGIHVDPLDRRSCHRLEIKQPQLPPRSARAQRVHDVRVVLVEAHLRMFVQEYLIMKYVGDGAMVANRA